MPESGVLANIRQEIDYSVDEWKNIIAGKEFKKLFSDGIKGDVLTRPPKGYDETNRAIEYIKMKSFIVSKSFTDAEVQNKRFIKDVTKTFLAMKPMIDFLNTSLE